VVTEEHETGVVSLGGVGEEVEQGVMVQQEVVRVSGLRPNDIRTLDRITAEEDGKVQPNNVIVAFASVQLDGKSTRIASLVGELASQGHRGEAYKGGCLLANSREEVCFL